MKTINKKAFTIVELVIVISIIGILAAVLIPTFGNLIEKANEANDTSFVKNINTMLIVEEVESGKPATYTQMKDVLAENGINIEKIKDTNTKNYKYAWNYSTNRMILMDDSFKIVEPSGEKGTISNKHDYYVIVSSEDEMKKYDGFGYYLADGFTGNNLTVKSGIDTGSNEGLTITVESEETFTAFVNTNKGVKLIVNAAEATINHYGSVTEVVINQVKNESYHEFGSVDFVTIEAGRIEVMTGGKVSGLKATGTSKVDMQEGAEIGAIEVVEAEGSNVVLDEKASANKLIKEEIEFAKMFARPNGNPFNGYGTEKSPFIIASMDDWKDMVKGYKAHIYINMLQVSDSTFKNSIEKSKTSYSANLYGYWKITCDLDFSNERDVLGISKLSGTLDFDGHTVKGFKKSNSINGMYTGGLVGNLKTETFTSCTKNFSNQIIDTEFVETYSGSIKNLIFENVTNEIGYSTVCTTISDGTIDNVTTFGTIESTDNNAAPFAFNIYSGVLNNCTNKTNVIGYHGMTSAFIGKADSIKSGKIIFENCVNYGNISNVGSGENYASMLFANNYKLNDPTLDIQNCKNYGNIISVVEGNANLVAKGFTSDGIENAKSSTGETGQLVNVGEVKTLTDENETYKLDSVTGTTKHKMVFGFTYKAKDANSKVHGTTAYVTNINNTDTVKAYDWINYNEEMTLSEEKVGDLTLYTTKINGSTYYVFKFEIANEVCITSSITIQYVAFGANDQPIAIYTTTVNCK